MKRNENKPTWNAAQRLMDSFHGIRLRSGLYLPQPGAGVQRAALRLAAHRDAQAKRLANTAPLWASIPESRQVRRARMRNAMKRLR
jgi:hypothetical protein